MKLLIDGDCIAYVCGYATESMFSERLVKKVVANKLNKICDTWGTYDFELFLTDSDRTANFRDSVATIKPYKGNRKGIKPKWLPLIREYLMDTFKAEMVTGQEADDELGIRQTEETMIVTIDKDLLMVPGRHYNFNTDRVWVAWNPGQLQLITKEKKTTVPAVSGKLVEGLTRTTYRHTLKGVGFKWFCAQCFLGDRVDNIPGLRGYGDKKTYTILDDIYSTTQLWDRTIKEFKEKKKLDQLWEVSILLWMRQGTPNDEMLNICLAKVDEAQQKGKKDANR